MNKNSENKICSTCKELKSIKYFGKRNESKDGYSYVCKDCKNKSARKKYYENPDNNRKRALKYYYENKKEVSEKQRTYRKKRREIDSVYRTKCNIRSLISHGINNNGYSKDTMTSMIIGCSYDELYVHLLLSLPKEERFAYIRNRDMFHIDHIVPMSLAETKEDVIDLNHYSNLQLLKKEENLKKSNKL